MLWWAPCKLATLKGQPPKIFEIKIRNESEGNISLYFVVS